MVEKLVNSVNVLQPKTSGNMPILKDLVLALIAVQENTQHGSPGASQEHSVRKDSL